MKMDKELKKEWEERRDLERRKRELQEHSIELEHQIYEGIKRRQRKEVALILERMKEEMG